MYLPNITAFFLSLPLAKYNGEDRIECRCPLCGDSRSDRSARSFNIKVNVEEKEPLLFNCYRASCQGGYLTPENLTKMGCTDMATLLEIATHNKSVKLKSGGFIYDRKQKNYELLNLDTFRNREKLVYLNRRLGWTMKPPDLRRLKIQLSIYDYLKINKIKKVPYPPNIMDELERNYIGFVSAFDDYIIFRCISSESKLNKRYINYRIDSKSKEETKMYIHPGTIDILDPNPTTLTVAEGIFSLYGGMYNTELSVTTPNKIFAANCGSHFYNTIMSTCAMYGITNIILNILSDSEISIGFYEKLYAQLRDSLDIDEFNVFKNELKEDFGYRRNLIKVNRTTLTKQKRILTL